MIIPNAQNYSPRPNLNIQHQSPVVIALGENDDALCYLAKLEPVYDGTYAVGFMASSLVLDRVRLFGTQNVLVRMEKDLWAHGLLSPLSKEWARWHAQDDLVRLSLQINGLKTPEADLGFELNLRT